MQIIAAEQKVNALNQLAAEGKVIKSTVSNGPSASSIWNKAGNTKQLGMDIDHTLDKQLGGTNALSNLSPLDMSVNRSFGAQVSAQIRDHPIGTAITAVSLFVSSNAEASSSTTHGNFWGDLGIDFLTPGGISTLGNGTMWSTPPNTGGASGNWGSSSGATGGWGSNSAAGGYLLYPNKANNNMMQSVYSK